MKRILAFCMLCCVLLLSACNRVGQMPIESVASSVSEAASERENRSIEDLNNEGVVFPIEGLYGKSSEQLMQSYSEAITDHIISSFWDTPVGIVLSVGGPVPYMYDKCTGMFTVACRDPLCSHEKPECIWANSRHRIFYGGNSLFFACRENDGCHSIYVGDMYGGNLRKLYQSNGNYVYSLTADADSLYFLEDTHNKETDQLETCLMRVSLNDGSTECLLTEVISYMPVGDKIVYIDQKDTSGYVYDLNTAEKSFFGNNVAMHGVYRDWFYYETEKKFYRASVDNLEIREPLFEDSNQNIIISGDVVFSGERLFYLAPSVFSESNKYGKYFKYDLYVANLDGSQATVFRSFETDGIPDTVTGFWIDGNMLFVKYRTYLDFRNEYNPHPANDRNPYRYSLIDLSTGKQLTFS